MSGLRGRALALALALAVMLAPVWFPAIAPPALALSDPNEMLANPAEEARAENIGRQLRCLVCQNESIEESGAGLAHDLRKIVRQQVVAGRTDKQVIAWMVARYGQFVRLRPPFDRLTFLLWASPALALLGGIGLAWYGRRNRATPAAPLSATERARLQGLIEP